MRINMVSLLAVLIALVVYTIVHPHLPWTPTRIIGAVVAIPSLLLLILARFQLGSSFAIRAKAQSLVTHGLYARIRNPIYVFGSLFLAGFVLYIGQPWWLCLFLVIIPMQIYRARNEAKVLEARFGADYVRYKSQTWF